MMHALLTSHSRRFLIGILLLAVCVVLAPRQFGGQTTYLVINGNSMEPLYRRGDLVLVRAAPAYQIGAIVAYRHPQLGVVIHRIIGRENERWVLQGDNNNFIDSYRPLESEFVGRSWLHIPLLGSELIFLRNVPVLTGLLLAAGTIGMTMVSGNPRRHNRWRRSRQTMPQQIALAGTAQATLFTVFALLSLASLVLFVFASARPTSNAVNTELSYQQRGRFDYSASAPPGIYDAPLAQTGDPVFRALSPALNVSFTYQFESATATELRGSYRLLAELYLLNGWKRSIELQPPQEFRGTTFEAQGVVDLLQLQRLIEQLEAQTGLEYQQFYLAILPQVSISGSLDEVPLSTTFTPRLDWLVDPLQLTMLRDTEQNPLLPVQTGVLVRPEHLPNRLGLFGLQLEVGQARLIGLLGFLLGGSAALVSGLRLYRQAHQSQELRIKLKYGPVLVEASGSNGPPPERVVSVMSIDDLARIAERYAAVIVHESFGDLHRYVVYEHEIAYIYVPHGLQQRLTQRIPAQSMLAPETRALEQVEPLRLCGWQKTFIEVIRQRGVTSEACQAAGIGLAAAYREREVKPEFAQAWDAARQQARQHNGPEGTGV